MHRSFFAMATSGALLIMCRSADAACTSFTQLQNGTVADASQVMSNFNAVLNGPCFSGNVGIGTTAPFEPLDVATTGGTAAWFQVSGSGGGAIGIARSTAYQWYLGIAGSSDFYLSRADTADADKVLYANASSGYVGIGTTSPSYLLTVNGTAYAVGAAGALSDIRHKTNVRTLRDGALAAVMDLRPVSFEWKDPKDDGMKGEQMGFIAQDVEKVLPSVVLTQDNAERTKGLKYNELIAVLTKAVQEQEADLRLQQQEIGQLKSRLAKLEGTRSTRFARAN